MCKLFVRPFLKAITVLRDLGHGNGPHAAADIFDEVITTNTTHVLCCPAHAFCLFAITFKRYGHCYCLLLL